MDLSPASLMFGIIFSAFGFATMQIGRKREDAKKIVIGVVLMGLTFVVGSTWWSWPLAGILLGVAYFP